MGAETSKTPPCNFLLEEGPGELLQVLRRIPARALLIRRLRRMVIRLDALEPTPRPRIVAFERRYARRLPRRNLRILHPLGRRPPAGIGIAPTHSSAYPPPNVRVQLTSRTSADRRWRI